MLNNMQATTAMGESLSMDDYPVVERAARELETNARELRSWDDARLGFKPSNRAEFDKYTRVQEEIAGKLVQAARQKNSSVIVSGLDEMLGKSCMGCHRTFREREFKMRSSRIFMNSFIYAWTEINRGLLLNDPTLVARSARTLVATGQVISWDPVLQSSFGLGDEARRGKFREYLNRMIGAAGRVEDAATRGEMEIARKSLVDMWLTGCLACHQEFR